MTDLDLELDLDIPLEELEGLLEATETDEEEKPREVTLYKNKLIHIYKKVCQLNYIMTKYNNIFNEFNWGKFDSTPDYSTDPPFYPYKNFIKNLDWKLGISKYYTYSMANLSENEQLVYQFSKKYNMYGEHQNQDTWFIRYLKYDNQFDDIEQVCKLIDEVIANLNKIIYRNQHEYKHKKCIDRKKEKIRRNKKIIELVNQGKKQKEIVEELGVSRKTIYNVLNKNDRDKK